MGYYMSQMDCYFRIAAADKAAAFDALKQWEATELEKHPDHTNSCYTPLGKAETLEDALGELDWEVESNEQGDIVGLYFTGEKLHDEDEWLDAIAPHVAKGSYLTMSGDDNIIWCWYFDGSHCMEYYGEVVFPDMPTDEKDEPKRMTCMVVLHYPESEWGDDYACFDVPATCSLSQVLDEVEVQQCRLNPDDFESIQAYAEAACDKAAEALNGSWHYMAQAGRIEITNETYEDEDGE